MLPSVPPSPSTAVLMFLFADKLLPPAPALRAKVEVPGRDVKVAANDLAATLLASSFWNLREQGLVALEPLMTRDFFIVPSPSLRVKRLQEATRPSIEYGIMEGLKELLASRGNNSSRPGESAGQEIKELIARRFVQGHSQVLYAVRREAVETGIVLAEDLKHHKFGDATRANCARWEAQADAIIALWKAFETKEATLHKTLLACCKTALHAAGPGSNSPAPFLMGNN